MWIWYLSRNTHISQSEVSEVIDFIQNEFKIPAGRYAIDWIHCNEAIYREINVRASSFFAVLQICG